MNGMICHRPIAPAGESAWSFRPDSPMAMAIHSTARSAGPPAPVQYPATSRAVSSVTVAPVPAGPPWTGRGTA